MEVAEQIVVMSDGKIEQSGGPRDLYEDPASEFVMSFVGPAHRLGDQWVRPHDVEVRHKPNGRTIEANARHCRETLALLGRLPQPNIAGCCPNAMFSLLAPGTHIPPHVGIANARLVCHLPLVVPSGCWFRVGAERRAWTPGEAFVFDDTIEHEAANDSDARRVVFIIDTWHPGLSPRERAVVAAAMEADEREQGAEL